MTTEVAKDGEKKAVLNMCGCVVAREDGMDGWWPGGRGDGRELTPVSFSLARALFRFCLRPTSSFGGCDSTIGGNK